MKNTARLLVAAFAMFQLVITAQPASSGVFGFTHVSVVDVATGRLVPDMTVIVSAGRISAVGRAGSLRAPAGAQLIDAKGKFLIPGLWDMHSHLSLFDPGNGREYLPLFLPNGVTGVRVMWGMPKHHQWQKEMESGSLMAPRMVIASPILDGPKPIQPGSVSVGSPEEGREAVRKSKVEGAEFIKVYAVLSREAFFAIADESKKLGLPLAGHVPQMVSALEASDAGMKSIEHLTGLLEASSTRESEMRELRRRIQEQRMVGTPDPALVQQFNRLEMDSYSKDKEEAVLDRYKRNHTWQIPTLTVLRTLFIYDESRRSDPRLKYVPASRESGWAARLEQLRTRPLPDSEFGTWVYGKQVEAVGMMKRAGVSLLAGTDEPSPYCFPGFSIHDELALLVQAGLTPVEALRTATINPAVFFGREADMGTVANGKIADLVLLDANPLQDIRNTTRINAVVANGRLLDRATLDKMLSQVESVAAASRKSGN